MNGAVRALECDAEQRQILSMSASKTVTYEVEHTRAPVFELSNNALSAAVENRPVLVVVDDRLWPSYGSQIDGYARANLNCVEIVRLAGNETTKSLEQVVALCSHALERDLPRHGAFIAVGGGTILDYVGFAASIYRRGVDYIRVPTTLIGMIDVGVGIKQAINFRRKKNLLGSFYAPRRTINDVRFLWTLPRRELAGGVAEALKIGLVHDGPLFELLEDHAGELVASAFRSPEHAATSVLLRAERAMMEQLAPNLYESELRRLVDFGHSFSPIIETTTDYAVSHGEAVALDMLLSATIAARRQLCDVTLVTRLIRLYQKIGLPTMHQCLSPLLIERALIDARLHRSGALNLVVPTGIGTADFLQDVGYDEVASALQHIEALA
jgi:3-dehydroquinate synthase